MWVKLEEILQYFQENYNVDYYRQGSFSDSDELPETFFTFWNVNVKDDSFYDNCESIVNHDWVIYFYTKNPSLIYSMPDELIVKLKENGFTIKNKPCDYNNSEPNYLCRYTIVTYMQGV